MTTKAKNSNLSQFLCTYQDHKKVSVAARNANEAACLARDKRKSLYGDNLNIVLSTVKI